jgi:hypothetical protein
MEELLAALETMFVAKGVDVGDWFAFDELAEPFLEPLSVHARDACSSTFPPH